jgi:hypothetical protein
MLSSLDFLSHITPAGNAASGSGVGVETTTGRAALWSSSPQPPQSFGQQ